MQKCLWAMEVERAEVVSAGYGEGLHTVRPASLTEGVFPKNTSLRIPPKCEGLKGRVCGCFVLLDVVYSRWSLHCDESASLEVEASF